MDRQVIRLLTAQDAAELAAVLAANREFMAPWEPVREDAYYTVRGQRALIDRALAGYAQGNVLPMVILDADGALAGRLTVSDAVRGPFRSGHLGYWVAADRNGRGLATAAVAQAIGTAFGEFGLHRLQAGTLLHNGGSQQVLRRNGFRPFGVAERYLNIAGRWQDHILYQRLADD